MRASLRRIDERKIFIFHDHPLPLGSSLPWQSSESFRLSSHQIVRSMVVALMLIPNNNVDDDDANLVLMNLLHTQLLFGYQMPMLLGEGLGVDTINVWPLFAFRESLLFGGLFGRIL